jgi:hypothetical protein
LFETVIVKHLCCRVELFFEGVAELFFLFVVPEKIFVAKGFPVLADIFVGVEIDLGALEAIVE